MSEFNINEVQSRLNRALDLGRAPEMAADIDALLAAPPGYVLVPVELAGRLQASIGAFVSDEGWGAADMDTADDLSALLAAAPEVK